MTHIQELIEQGKKDAAENGVELTLYFSPYAEKEHETIGYCPTTALKFFTHIIILGTIAASGDVIFNEINMQ
jgi:hypothetical protein